VAIVKLIASLHSGCLLPGLYHGLQVTLDCFTTRAQQNRALDVLQFKRNDLWSMRDAIDNSVRIITGNRLWMPI